MAYSKLKQINKTSNPEKIEIFTIWLIGLITFLIGFMIQLIKTRDIYVEIFQLGDTSIAEFSFKLKNTFETSISGLTVLIFSLIMWGVLNYMKFKKIKTPN